MNQARILLATLVIAGLMATLVDAQRGPGPGAGGRGRGSDERHEADHDVLHFLLDNHEKISRTVKRLENGVETLTESDDPAIARKIQEHVEWMQWRVEGPHPIRMRDPLFAELFRHTAQIKMSRVDTEKGVRVTETSDDPHVARLIQAHADVVSQFVAHGFAEAMKNHAVPGRSDVATGDTARKEEAAEAITYINPAIARYGKVVALPEAAQQPRAGSRIIVDVTAGSDATQLNPAIEKVARYVNIYRGAGKAPADVELAVILHGEATLAVLNAEAYAAEFGTESNPNVDCLQELHEAGVSLFVCGQSLVGKGHRPEDVLVFVDTAVSALTALVNHQTDGYAYIPLK